MNTLLYELNNYVATITLNRPDKRNAMNPTMHNEMSELLKSINADPEVRVIVITGAGKSFCAGADIKEFFKDLEDKPLLREQILATAWDWMWKLLAESPKATVAMINGHCFGGGLLVAMACDIAVAGDEAIFGLPEINWGHVPGGAASLKTIEFMGYRKALYYAMTGISLSPEKAEEEGLITRSVAQSDLLSEVTTLANLLAEKSPPALKTVKEIYRHASHMTIDQTHDFVNSKVDQLRLKDADGLRNQGMNAFINKQLRTT
jgi:trans-feruloyl-CoA hydratase/vanillin synthase